jgi:predicted kinase
VIPSRARPPLVLVTGMPASGKTTLAGTLHAALHVPLLAKDEVKEALTRVAGTPADRAESRVLGAHTMTVLYELAAAHLERGVGIVLECNFRRGLAEPGLRPLVEVSRCVEVHCVVDGQVAIERYRARASGRHGAHAEEEVLAEADPAVWAAVHPVLDLGVPVLEVVTSDGYEPGMNEIVEWVERHMVEDTARTDSVDG